jgi:hypothetical protein
MAGAIFLLAISSFNYLSKSAQNYLPRAKMRGLALCQARSEMERVRRLPFDILYSAGSVEVTRIDDDLCLVRVDQLYTLRSRYQ